MIHAVIGTTLVPMSVPRCLTDVVEALNRVNLVGKDPVLGGIVEGKQNVSLCSRTTAITAVGQCVQVVAAMRARYRMDGVHKPNRPVFQNLPYGNGEDGSASLRQLRSSR